VVAKLTLLVEQARLGEVTDVVLAAKNRDGGWQVGAVQALAIALAGKLRVMP
jgi:hypothetical protein